MYNIYSIIIGALIGLMTSLNGILSTYTGNYISSVLIHFVGLIGVVAILIFTKTKLTFDKTLPLTLYSAGVIGVFTVLFNNYTFVPIGASLTMALGLLGQTLSSIIIDNFGLLGVKVNKFNKKKIIGLVIISIGIIIMTIY
ncbi:MULTISPECIES: DMT family transporter [Clostridium]|uniref:DMT family transporter n=1 Tax=Clostridium cibarium TaxID=2762247 RepID=A0ABR8PVF5_9CLOT|nr:MULTISPECIES: DMT family transporter [Clostridium]MBD7912113.1 DMT family transporter [Clostridium cibarium]